MRSLGMGEDAEAWLNIILRLIYLLQVLNLTIAAIEAATGPIGWVMAGTRMLGAAIAVNSLREGAEHFKRW